MIPLSRKKISVAVFLSAIETKSIGCVELMSWI